MPQRNPTKAALEFAISREVDAYHFYMTLAERIEGMEMKRVFDELAEEELDHKEMLELELIKKGLTLPTQDELSRHSEAPITEADINLILKMNYKELLMVAIKKEEASFRTYVNLVHKMCDEESRDTLLAIAEEEIKHKLRFEMEYEMLSKQSNR